MSVRRVRARRWLAWKIHKLTQYAYVKATLWLAWEQGQDWDIE